jgi:radical SAM superfamily enzyme YgiQ (UPF0313 family)
MFDFEQGPIRPPSEAKSLLIRATRNCPWNRCEFCHTYKGQKFAIRSVDEIKQDIQKVRDIAEDIRQVSWRLGHGGAITDEVVQFVFGQYPQFGQSHRSMAYWLYFGGTQAFIQDANSLIMKTEDLVGVLAFLREKFPQINRITSYARSKTLAKKTVEELRSLHEAGLSRIHVGMETGYDPLLAYVRMWRQAKGSLSRGFPCVNMSCPVSVEGDGVTNTPSKRHGRSTRSTLITSAFEPFTSDPT